MSAGPGTPAVSVVIPARDAARTLGRTLASLASQTRGDWEAIVVDDGSRDATATLAAEHAARDPRVRPIAGEGRGVARARNAGLAAARGEIVLFLDADDTLEPRALELLVGRLEADPQISAAAGGWARVGADGTVLTEDRWRESQDAFTAFARECVFCIHCCAVRRDALVELGGFDPDLRICEDWDLWIRLARTGARFGSVAERVAAYRIRADSASFSDGARMMRDGLVVARRAHAADSRVRDPAPENLAGRPGWELPEVALYLACWCAGLEIGHGRDPGPVLDLVPDVHAPLLDPWQVADVLVETVSLTFGVPLGRWPDPGGATTARIDEFLADLEVRSGTRRLRGATRRWIDARRLGALDPERPARLGRLYAVDVEVTERIGDVAAPRGVDRLEVRVLAGGEPVGDVLLPVFEGGVPAAVLADAIAARHAWALLRRLLTATLYPEILVAGARGHSAHREGVELAAGLPADPPAAIVAAHERIGWSVLLQELFDRAAWPAERFYDPAAEDRAAPLRRSTDGTADVELSAEPFDLALPPGTDAAVTATVGGSPLGVVRVPAVDGRVRAQALRARTLSAAGFELCRLVVREGILGRPLDDGVPLRARLAEAAGRSSAIAAGEAPPFGGAGELVLGRRRGAIGTSASRRASLPAAGAETLEELATRNDETARVPSAVATAVRYVPELLGGAGAEPLDPPMPPEPPEPAPRGWSTVRLPILMYHRIADRGPAALARFRTAPVDFEAQLAHLNGEGFRTIGVSELVAAALARSPIPGRAVLITFDDGYADFAETAWPLLRRYGFGACLFLASDHIGGASTWDVGSGEPAPLMGWDEIRALVADGVEVGSHGVSHAALGAIDAEDAALECARSRAALEDGLGRPVRAISYPFGDADAAVAHLAGACGYEAGFKTGWTSAHLLGDLLQLPRIEVAAGLPPERFAAYLRG